MHEEILLRGVGPDLSSGHDEAPVLVEGRNAVAAGARKSYVVVVTWNEIGPIEALPGLGDAVGRDSCRAALGEDELEITYLHDSHPAAAVRRERIGVDNLQGGRDLDLCLRPQ